MPIFFSRNILYLRKQQGLSQDEMQTKTGILRSTWSNYENGHTQPSFEVLNTIAAFFGVSIDDLLNREMGGAEPETERSSIKSKNKKQNYPIQEAASSYVNEKEASEFWLVARELKRINEKLDSIQNIINKER